MVALVEWEVLGSAEMRSWPASISKPRSGRTSVEPAAKFARDSNTETVERGAKSRRVPEDRRTVEGAAVVRISSPGWTEPVPATGRWLISNRPGPAAAPMAIPAGRDEASRIAAIARDRACWTFMGWVSCPSMSLFGWDGASGLGNRAKWRGIGTSARAVRGTSADG